MFYHRKFGISCTTLPVYPCFDAGNLGFPSKGKSHWGPAPLLLLKRNLLSFFAHPCFATGKLGFPPSLFILGLLQEIWDLLHQFPCSALFCYRKFGISKDQRQSWGHLPAPPLLWGETSKHNSWMAFKEQTCLFQL